MGSLDRGFKGRWHCQVESDNASFSYVECRAPKYNPKHPAAVNYIPIDKSAGNA
jgi:hypothetical protein